MESDVNVVGVITTLLVFGLLIIFIFKSFTKIRKAQKKQKRMLKDLIENDERFANYKTFNIAMMNKIYISEKGYICIPMLSNKIIHINDINGFDVIKNGKSSGGLGSAVAGGLLFGGVGAVTGAVIGSGKKEVLSNLSLVLKVNDFDNPTIHIPFIMGKVKSDSLVARAAEQTISEILATLEMLEKKYKTA